MYVVVDRDNLLIGVKRRESPTTVVVFSGVGIRSGAEQIHEFRGLKAMRGPDARADGAVNIISVIDRHRRWFNEGLTSIIAQHVDRIAARIGSERVVTVGNSMGGFGSVIFAKRLAKCRQAIAFVPHSSVHPSLAAFDPRSAHWRTRIANWDTLDAIEEIAPDIRYDLFFGGDAIDLAHADRFERAARPNVTIHRVSGVDHNLSNQMRDDGTLYPTLARIIWRSAAQPTAA